MEPNDPAPKTRLLYSRGPGDGSRKHPGSSGGRLMLERRVDEVKLLRRKYKEIDHGPQYDWIIVRNVAIPPGWNRLMTDVLLLLGPAYPNTPPDNFYVPTGLRLSNGHPPGGFTLGNFAFNCTNWDTFSWHHEAGWTPAANIEDGSNLLDVMREIERRLSEAS